MSKFKVGDKVMLINVDRYTYYVDNIPNKLLGKPLVINSISTDKSGNEIVYAGVPEGVCCWQWYSDDLRLVSETQTESADQAPAEMPEPKHSKQFKVGDYVVPVCIDKGRSFMQDKVLRVVAVDFCDGRFNVCAGLFFHEVGATWWDKDDLRYATPEEIASVVDPVEFKDGDKVVLIESSKVATVRNKDWGTRYPLTVNDKWISKYGVEYWSDQVIIRHATPEEIAASKKPKPLRRGDLVLYREQIGIVHNIDSDGYWVAALTGDGCCVHKNAKDLMRIGSIRKKIKRIKKEMEGSK